MATQLRIQLKGITNPTIWRRIVIPDNYTFRQLHFCIQLLFGWFASYPYRFEALDNVRELCISEPCFKEKISSKITSASQASVHEIIERYSLDKLIYIYDFVGKWSHLIEVEDSDTENIGFPRCIGGGGNNPPEQSGCAAGYEDIKRIIRSSEKTEDDLEELNTIFENLNQYTDDELDDDGYPLPSADENHAGWRRFNIEEFSVERANQELHNELEWLENNVGKFYDEAQ